MSRHSSAAVAHVATQVRSPDGGVFGDEAPPRGVCAGVWEKVRRGFRAAADAAAAAGASGSAAG
eukprot:11158872-Lingulodinium_polyedra.AAC.1